MTDSEWMTMNVAKAIAKAIILLGMCTGFYGPGVVQMNRQHVLDANIRVCVLRSNQTNG